MAKTRRDSREFELAHFASGQNSPQTTARSSRAGSNSGGDMGAGNGVLMSRSPFQISRQMTIKRNSLTGLVSLPENLPPPPPPPELPSLFTRRGSIGSLSEIRFSYMHKFSSRFTSRSTLLHTGSPMSTARSDGLQLTARSEIGLLSTARFSIEALDTGRQDSARNLAPNRQLFARASSLKASDVLNFHRTPAHFLSLSLSPLVCFLSLRFFFLKNLSSCGGGFDMFSPRRCHLHV